MTRNAVAFGSLAVVLLAASCSAVPSTPRCQRYDVAALVPANDFTAIVPMGKFQALDQPGERIGLDMTLIRPLSGNLALVHAIGGKEVARWKLDIPAGDGIAVWCDIGVSKSASHCGAVISNHPHPLGGYYYLLTNGNKVLEAGLSFYLCD